MDSHLEEQYEDRFDYQIEEGEEATCYFCGDIGSDVVDQMFEFYPRGIRDCSPQIAHFDCALARGWEEE